MYKGRLILPITRIFLGKGCPVMWFFFALAIENKFLLCKEMAVFFDHELVCLVKREGIILCGSM